MTLQEDALGRSYDAGLMRRMLGYLRPRRGLVAVAVALLIVNALLALVGPVLTRQALDVAVGQKDEGLDPRRADAVGERPLEARLQDLRLAARQRPRVVAPTPARRPPPPTRRPSPSPL